jgi:hypothetical protein
VLTEKLHFDMHLEAMRLAHGEKPANLFKLSIKNKSNTYGSKFSSNFSNLKNKLFPNTNRSLVFHSFRHNIATLLREKGYPFDVISSITGHSVAITSDEKKIEDGVLKKIYQYNIRFVKEKKEIADLDIYPFLDERLEKLGEKIQAVYQQILTNPRALARFKKQ